MPAPTIASFEHWLARVTYRNNSTTLETHWGFVKRAGSSDVDFETFKSHMQAFYNDHWTLTMMTGMVSSNELKKLQGKVTNTVENAYYTFFPWKNEQGSSDDEQGGSDEQGG
jgi:hypothetical protein